MLSAPTGRPLRADASRNRQAIIVAAREAFAEDGVGSSLDGIAIRAGVGNATLYRNFPTREDLLVAVMQEGIESAASNGRELRVKLPAREAMAEWLFRLAWHLRTWHDLPSKVVASMGDPASPLQEACAPLRLVTSNLFEDARDARAVVDTVTPDEVFELVTILSWGLDRYGDDPETARKRLSLATAGIFA